MTDKDGPGQATKKAADDRTADVAAENQAQAEPPKTAAEADVEQRIGTDQTPERADDAPERAPVDASRDPYPDYGAQTVDELAALAESRGVEINHDVEKAELIHLLRENDGDVVSRGETQKQVEGAANPYASYDVMPLEQLRQLADSRDVKLGEEFRRAHLVTELRAADTSGGVGVSVTRVDSQK